MRSRFLFSCVTLVVLGLAGGSGQGRAAGAKLAALSIEQNEAPPGVTAGALKPAGCAGNCAAERLVEGEAGTPDPAEDAARLRRAEANRRGGLLMLLLQILRSPK